MVILSTITLVTAFASAQVGGSHELYTAYHGHQEHSRFGRRVRPAGDFNQDGYADLMIGAPREDSLFLPAPGSVSIYSGIDHSVLFRVEGQSADENLGYDFDHVGDVNGDGIDDIIIGSAYASGSGLSKNGQVSIYSGLSGALLHKLTGTSNDEGLGWSVTGVGDQNGDSFDDFAAGSKQNKVYVYSGADGSLMQTYTGPWNAYDFGFMIRGGSDLDGDGIPDLLISEPCAYWGSTDEAGIVYAYSGATGDELFKIHGHGSEHWIGTDFDLAGDVDGDGFDDIVVDGSYGDHPGHAYVHSGHTGAMIYDLQPNRFRGYFGVSVSGAGDWDQDGHEDILVGDPADYWLATNDRAHVYSGRTGNKIFSVIVNDPSDFGLGVCHVGDMNGDGFSEVAIGASRFTQPGGPGFEGGVFVYSFNPYLSLSHETISAATGAEVEFKIKFTPDSAGKDYKVLASASGTGPTNYGIDIPLTLDSLVIDTYRGNYGLPNHSAMHGVLDTNGDATASMTIPAGLPSSMIGNSYWFAVIAEPSGGLPEATSISREVVIIQ